MFEGCPSFFVQLNTAITRSTANRSAAKAHGFKIKQNRQGVWYVDGLNGAASRWRLADSVNGLSFAAEAKRSSGWKAAFSDQAQIAMSVLAYEAFLRVFKKNWYERYSTDFDDDEFLASKVRKHILDNNDVRKMLCRGANRGLRERLLSLKDGDTQNVFPVCMAIRHAFFHGHVGSGLVFSGDLAQKLKSYVLCGIETRCKKLTAELEEAERTAGRS